MENKNYDFCIIGGGIIGAAIARELSKYNKKILILEANKRVAMETSQGNSGLVHGGFDPTPGKLNAKLNLLGKKRYEDWIKELDFPYQRINSLVVAFNDEEMQHVKMLYDRGITNGLEAKEMQILTKAEIIKIEPNLNPDIIGGLLCNSSIAIDPVELSKVLFENAITNHAELKVNSKVSKIAKQNDVFEITVNGDKTYYASKIINVAGHYADEIAAMAGYPDFKLETLRGEYRILEKSEASVVSSVIFMVPTIHGKGVIVAPTLDGHLLVGPTAQKGVLKSETRLVTPEKFNQIGEIGRKLIPNLKIEKTCMTFSGSRPIEPSSEDFYIKPAIKDDNFINVAGTKSPAISAAPAIADYVIDILKSTSKDKFEIKKDYQPYQKSILPMN
ncbi:type 2 glycerol-3-phosphate oxidase [Spiroplasma endosymbiont of Panorpa germanica]|uniref:type 2 glycerol-3-phosphate oxidase n=1 Tax=Spiroplasma endosymbiont of Panorpa germanica TaxID=3066314 RepID=UPI0030CFB095